MSTNLKPVNEESFENEVLTRKDLVLVDFWAPWCGPCNRMLPILEEVAQNITVFKVNIDENPKLTSRYGVSAVPTLIFIREGQFVRRLVGIQPKELLLSEVERFQAPNEDEQQPTAPPVASDIQETAPLPEARTSAPVDVPPVPGEGQAVS